MQKITKNNAKSCFSVKKLIPTSERGAEHQFAGQNTQHTGAYDIVAALNIELNISSNQ